MYIFVVLGKGGVNVIIVDGDYERSSSSVEDESIPMISSNITLLSPITASEPKTENTEPEAILAPPIVQQSTKPVTPKTETAVDDNLNASPQSIWVRIQLSKLNVNCIPALRKQFENTRPWLLEPKIPPKLSPRIIPKTEDYTMKDDDHHSSLIDSRSNVLKTPRGEVLKDNKSDQNKDAKNDHIKEARNEVKKISHPGDHHRDRKHKSKKRKRRNSSSSISSHSTISNLSQSSRHNKHLPKEPDDSKSKRRKDDSESRSQTENLNLTTTPPTNHEREASRTPFTKNSDHISPNTKPRSNRQYRSYFEPPDEPPDLKKR